MKSNEKPSSIGWKQIAFIAVVLALAGVQWYTGIEIFGSGEEIGTDSSAATATVAPDERSKAGADLASESKPKSKSPAQTQRESYLQPGRGKNLESPGGLVYTGGRSGHRADHVLRHARDIPDRDVHGVFNQDGDELFRLIDEVYELIKNKSSRVRTQPGDDGKTAYIVDMQREVGFKGGRSGKRDSHPPLYKIKLVLADNRVVTAYPF